MDVKSGRLFLTDEKNNPEYCLVLANGQLNQNERVSSPDVQEQGLAGLSFRHRRGILINDAEDDPRWVSWANTPEATTAGSALAVPIMIADQPIGALALIADQPNHFTENDLTLITDLTEQIGIMVENTRLKNRVVQSQKTLSALRQTTHTISTSVELDQILRTILRQLLQVVPYEYAMVLLEKDKQLYPATYSGFEASDTLSQLTISAVDIPVVYEALDQGQVISDGAENQPVDLEGLHFPKPIRSWAVAPLTAHRKALGGIVLVSPRSHVSASQNTPTISAFADHIAIAVANHRLAQETERRLRELAFLNESGQAITSTLNLDRILNLLLERVRELLQIDAASIALRDERTGELVFEAASGEGAEDVIGVRLKPGQGIAGWVAQTGKPLSVQNAYNDARFFAGIDKQTGMMTQSILCTPILLQGQVAGVIEALNPGDLPFDEQAIDLLTALAGLAATAIDNARLFARVRRAETRYEGLFEDSANPIIITDLKGVIVEVNRNAYSLLGQSKEALSGTNLTHFQSADGNLDFVEPFNQIQSGKEVIFETDILSGGQRITIEINAKRILVKGTALIQWIGRDISAEIELEQIREDMVRMLIHDLRNPLANIMNSLDILNDVILEKDTSVSQFELLEIAKRSGKRMHQLISSILDISRLETGEAILDTRPTDLVPLLRDAVDFINPQANIRNILITTSFPPELPQVDIDQDMISRVVLNLLDNATKYTQMGGTISLSANVLGSEVEVAIADNGPGIATDQLQIIFEKYFRVREKGGPQGAGLGLAFCKLAVTVHGGRIWAESILGKGTTLRFAIPIKAADPSN
jgi:PAS domain S-box-containing protein